MRGQVTLPVFDLEDYQKFWKIMTKTLILMICTDSDSMARTRRMSSIRRNRNFSSDRRMRSDSFDRSKN